jgi:hypothetical protein
MKRCQKARGRSSRLAGCATLRHGGGGTLSFAPTLWADMGVSRVCMKDRGCIDEGEARLAIS